MAGFTGGCLCGGIRYEVRSDPIRVLNCHCNDCRRVTGASFATVVFVKADDLAFVKGAPREFRHRSSSGATMTKAFCPDCGSQILTIGSRSAGEMGINVGSIDDAAFVRPTMDLFVSRSLPFVRLSDETRHFAEGRPR